MRNLQQLKKQHQLRRRARVRAKIFGTVERPRLSAFRSLKETYVQLIDDTQGKTLVAAGTKEIKKDKLNKTQQALELGKLLAQRALAKNIKVAVFDRGGYRFHGRVKAVAEGARAGGLKI